MFTVSLERGGAELVFVNLANHWVNQGHMVDYVAVSSCGSLLSEIDSRVNVYNLISNECFLPKRLVCVQKFCNYLKKYSPDIVYATITYATITAALAKKISGFNGRLILRQANSLVNQSNKSICVRLWNWFGYKICYRWADCYLVNSINSRDELVRLLPRDLHKIKLIYNPLTPKFTTYEDFDREPGLVMTCGRLTEQKDYPTLLRAFKLVTEELDGVRLIIFGDGAKRSAIEELVGSLGLADSVKLMGVVDNIHEFYAKASVFVLASKWEGFPNVLIEALASGVPVVTTDCRGACREIAEPILPNSIVPVGDHVGIARRIIESLNSKHSNLLYHNYVSENYSISVIAQKYLDC